MRPLFGSDVRGISIGRSPTAAEAAAPLTRGWGHERSAGPAWTPLSLRRNFSWTLVGTVVYAACQFATLSVLAHFSGSAIVGLFALGLAMTEPIFLFANLSLRTVQATDARRLFPFSDYLGLRLTTTVLALLVTAIAAISGGHRDEALAAIAIIGAIKAIEALSDVGYGLLQQRERMDRIATSMMLKGVGGLAAFTSALALSGSLLWALLALAAARGMGVVFYDVRQIAGAVGRDQAMRDGDPVPPGRWWSALRPRWERPSLIALVRLSFPLGIVLLLVSLGTNIPRLVLAESAGAASLGIFASMAYFVLVGDTLAKALSQASVPRLAAFHAAGDVVAFRQLVGRLLLVGVAIGVAGLAGAAVLGGLLLEVLYGPEFARHTDVLVMVMGVGAVTIIGDYLGVAITAMRQFAAQVWVHLIAVAVLLGTSGLLIQRYGLHGTAIAALLGALVVTAGFSAVLVRELRAAGARRLATPEGTSSNGMAQNGTRPTATVPRMRITFLVRSLDYGGAERQLCALARGLHARGHRIVVAVFYGNGPLERELRDAGVPVHVLDKAGRWDLSRFMARLIRFLRQERPDILHGYLDTPNLIGIGVRLIVPTKVVAGIRSSDPHVRKRDWLANLHYHAEQRLIRHADLVVVNSRAGVRTFGANRLCDNRTVVIPNGIDSDRFRPDPAARGQVRHELGIDDREKLIGLVARLDPIKDHETFLRSAALLLQRDDVRFICIGSGQERYERELRKLGSTLGLDNRLIWSGARDDMPALYNALDVAVLSSLAEGFPNVLGEAMACGVPCVATDVGDAAWIVGDTGRIVPPRDPQALRSAIIDVLDGIDRGGSRGPSPRERIVANFSLVALVDSTEAVLRRLLVVS